MDRRRKPISEALKASEASSSYADIVRETLRTTAALVSESVAEAEMKGKELLERFEAMVDLRFPGRQIMAGSLYKHWHMVLTFCAKRLEEADESLADRRGDSFDEPFPTE